MGIGQYKHVYFNATSNTFIIWTITVVFVITIYEGTRHVLLVLFYGSARPRMFILFLSNIYPHVYTWWMYFSYHNDEFYPQWWHQLFFSTTELLSTLMVIHLVNKSNTADLPQKLLFIIR